MIEAAADALVQLVTVENLGFMMLGVSIGLCVGVLPGLSGTSGMAVLLPFVFGMDPVTGMALLIGMASVVHTADTFASVLLGVPGSAGSQATIMDGYPLAQQGQAGRALSAAFMSSLVGGVIGAVMLFGTILVARPIVLALGSPELFMLALVGLSLVGILSRGDAIAGLLSGVLGLMLGAIGAAPGITIYRYSFDLHYLWDGIPLAVLALGLFAVPELIDLAANKTAISRTKKLVGGRREGLRDVIRHRWLVVRSAALGNILGVVPGIGGAVVDWISYAFAQSTSKNSEGFGSGDIRGVIAPESSNNAKEGGALVPTLLFSIPGSGTSAMLLGGLILMGVQAGPSMVAQNLNVTLTVIWTLAIANVVGTLACLSISGPVARLSLISGRRILPFLVVLIVIASFQTSRNVGDVIALLAVGCLGWVMKRYRWPRPPLLIGFVLSVGAERFLFRSMSRYGFEWLTRPLVLVFATLVAVIVVTGVVQSVRHAARMRRAQVAVAEDEGDGRSS